MIVMLSMAALKKFVIRKEKLQLLVLKLVHLTIHFRKQCVLTL